MSAIGIKDRTWDTFPERCTYDEKINPILNSTIKKYCLGKLEETVEIIRFAQNDDDVEKECRGYRCSSSIMNTTESPIMMLDKSGFRYTIVNNNPLRYKPGKYLQIIICTDDVKNIRLPDINWKEEKNSIDKVIRAVTDSFITYAQTCRNPNKKDPIEYRSKMYLAFSIDLEYFLNNIGTRILYIETLGLRLGNYITHLGSNSQHIDDLQYAFKSEKWFDATTSSWSYYYIVDNSGTLPPLWGNIAGKPAVITKVKDLDKEDGLYIVTCDAFVPYGKHICIPAEDLKAGAGKEYGCSFYEEDIAIGKCNKAYIDLENQYKKQLEEAEKENEKLTARVEAILKDIDKIEKEKEKLRHEERIKAFEMQRLKDQVERSKSESGFRFTGLIITVITGIIGIFTSLKKIFSK